MMELQSRWEIFVGFNDGDTDLPLSQKRVLKVLETVGVEFIGFFGGCTIVSTVGYWGGKREDGAAIIVVTNKPTDEAHPFIRDAARFIIARLNQQAVFVTKSVVETELFTR